MNICFVYQSNYPWDIRVSKILQTLVDSSHNIFLVCANELDYRREENIDGVKINRLPFINKTKILTTIINFPAFFNPFWKIEIEKSVKKNRIDLIIVRDLPLALTALKVGSKYNIPVFMDMAESYPELLRSMWQFGAVSPIKRITHNPRLGDIVEKKVLKKVDHIFAMIEESKDRLIRLGADPDKITIVSNTPPLNKFNIQNYEAKQSNDSVIKILYAGWVTKGRGVDLFLKCLSDTQYIKNKRLKIDIYGAGDALDICKQIVINNNIDGIVQFHGWCSNDEIVRATQECHIGLVSHRYCGHWNNTIPNKLFDYMASGIPVLSSNTIPVERIIKKTNSGMIYEEGNVKSIDNALEALNSRSLRLKLARNGINAIKEQYNWETDGQLLLNIVNTLDSKT